MKQLTAKNVESKLTYLGDTLHQFIAEYRLHDSSEQVTEVWTVKDILCHLTYWHMYYADNLSAAAKGKSFVLSNAQYPNLKISEVESMRPYSDAALTTYLAYAQEMIENIIRKGTIKYIVYREGFKPCPIPEFLDVVTGHIRQHTTLLRLLRQKHLKSGNARKGYL